MVLAAVLALLPATLPVTAGGLPPRPRLVVVLSVDQFRQDYVARFAEHYLPAKRGSTVGGLNWLSETGADFIDAHFQHAQTFTGPGHSIIMTGSVPALTGIVDNDWFDRTKGKVMYCVDDESVKTVGGNSGPMSPANLKVSTVGDELKMATGGKAKVVGVAFKDRGAILMAGHAADTCIWFDGGNGDWVTSTFYAPGGKLPDWVTAINAENIPDKAADKTWTPLLPDEAYALTKPAPFVKGEPTKPVFSHKIGGSNAAGTYRNFTASGFGQDYVLDTAYRAIEAEGLGQDEVPDVLCINLATNDYVGHTFGPNSPEAMDISIRTDRALSTFFNAIDKKVGLSRTVVVLTADHGVAPIPEEAGRTYRNGSIGRRSSGAIRDAVSKALAAKFGEGAWVQHVGLPHIYLNRALAASRNLSMAEVELTAAEAVRSVEGIYWAFTGQDIMAGRLPAWGWVHRVTNGFYPPLCGDVMAYEAPGNLFAGGTGTSHGSPWAYDTHVPILIQGAGVRAGKYSQQVSVSDIAPTLSRLLRIEQPNGNVGRVLPAVGG